MRRRNGLESLLDRALSGDEILVPAHWPLEVVNALLIARRRGRVTADQITEFIEDPTALPIRIAAPRGPVEWRAVLRLAEEYQRTAYDAAYLELAQNTGLPLATLDGELRTAAVATQAHRLRKS